MKKLLMILLLLSAVCAYAATEEAGPIWSLPGAKLALPALFEDGNGGAIILTHDIRAYDAASSNITKVILQARRLSADGGLLWLTNLGTNDATGAIAMGEGFSAQKNAARAADYNYLFGIKQIKPTYTGRAGGVIWNKSLSTTSIARPGIDGGNGNIIAGVGGNGGMYVWKLDSSGNLWSPGAVAVVQKASGFDMDCQREASQLYPLSKDSDGNILITWTEATPEGASQDNSSTVYAQKVNGSTGALLWNSGNPVRVSPYYAYDQTSTVDAHANEPVICSDGAGGAFLLWSQQRTAKNLWIAHISSEGTVVAGPAQLGSYSGVNPISLVATTESGINYIYALWQTASNYYIQKYNNSMVAPASWASPVVVPGKSSTAYLVPDGHSGLLFSYNTGTPDYTARVARITGGAVQWTADIADTNDTPTPLALGNEQYLFACSSFESAFVPGAAYYDVPLRAVCLTLGSNEPVWSQTLRLGRSNYSALPASDGRGGAIISCFNRNKYPTTESEVFCDRMYAQRISGETGEIVWQNVTAVTVETSAGEDIWPLISVNAGTGESNVWLGKSPYTSTNLVRVGDQSVDSISFNAQKLEAASGRKLWGYDGTPFYQQPVYIPAEVGSLAVAADDRGGAIYTWTYSNEVYASWVDTNGSPETAFGLNAVKIAVKSFTSRNQFPQVQYVGSDTAVILWDHRSTGVKEMRARTLNRNTAARGTTNSIAHGRSGMFVTRNSYALGDGRIIAAIDDGDSSKAKAVLISATGTRLGTVETPVGYWVAEVAPSADGNLLFSYLSSSETYGLIAGQIFVSKVSVSSLEGAVLTVDPTTAWQVLASGSPKSANFCYSISADGSGGAVVIFNDIANLSAAQVQRLNDLLISSGINGLLSAESASLPITVYGQRLSQSGERLWGDRGVLLASGSKAQFWPDSIKSAPNGTAILGYLDMTNSYNISGQFGFLLEAAVPIKKVGAVGQSAFTVAADGMSISSADKRGSSASPEVLVALASPDNIASLKIFVNNELKLNKTTGLSASNTFTLDLSTKGSYDIKVLVTDKNGNESVISFTLESPGAGVLAVVGALTVTPTPYTPGTRVATISYVLANDTPVRLMAISPTGGEPVIYRAFAAGTPGGMASYNAVAWDGKDRSGNYCGTGIYPVRLLTDDGKELGKAYIVVK
jgi:hypothetical protein